MDLPDALSIAQEVLSEAIDLAEDDPGTLRDAGKALSRAETDLRKQEQELNLLRDLYRAVWGTWGTRTYPTHLRAWAKRFDEEHGHPTVWGLWLNRVADALAQILDTREVEK